MTFDARNLKPVNLIVVRHGETQANKEGWIMAQWHDLPLNEKGQADAVEVADALAQHPFIKDSSALIWTSPLKRAAQSAEALAQRTGLEIIKCPSLLERDFGELSGKSWQELEEMFPGFKERDKQLKYDYRPYSGEDAGTVRRRTEEALACAVRHCRRTGRHTALFFTHFGIVGMIYNIATGKYLEAKNLQHFAFNVTYDMGWWPYVDFIK
jgi:broad specificity phosphatase PhoE